MSPIIMLIIIISDASEPLEPAVIYEERIRHNSNYSSNNDSNNNTMTVSNKRNGNNDSPRNQQIEEDMHLQFLPLAPEVSDEERIYHNNNNDSNNSDTYSNNDMVTAMSKQISGDIILSEFRPTASFIDSEDNHPSPIGLRLHEFEENSPIFSPLEAFSFRTNLGTNTTNDTTPTTTNEDTMDMNNNSDAISTATLPSVLCQPDEFTPTTHNSLEENPSLDPTSTTHIYNVGAEISRVCPPRFSKTKALEQICAMTNFLPDDAREISHSQLPNVQLLSGPQTDETAHAGDRLGTYEGVRYTDPEDLNRMRSPQVVSDYLYEATDPFTDTTVILDATPPSSCYGR